MCVHQQLQKGGGGRRVGWESLHLVELAHAWETVCERELKFKDGHCHGHSPCRHACLQILGAGVYGPVGNESFIEMSELDLTILFLFFSISEVRKLSQHIYM